MMALTFRWTVPSFTTQIALAGLSVFLTGTVVLLVLCGGHMDALQAAGAFKGGKSGVSHTTSKRSRAISCGWAAQQWAWWSRSSGSCSWPVPLG